MRAGRFVVVAAFLLTARGARADSPQAQAKALFDEGLALIDGADQLGDPAAKVAKLDAACNKFAQSLQLDPRLGTQLNLADCRQREGKLVDAYATYQAALATATRTHDRAAFVQKQIAALAGKLVKITLHVGEPERDGLVVEVSGRQIARADWQTVQVAEPGSIVVRASAPGRLPATIRRDAAAGSEITVDVPGLEPARGGAAPTPPTQPQVLPPPTTTPGSTIAPTAQPLPAGPERSSERASAPLWPWFVAGAGVVGLGATGAFMLVERSRYNDTTNPTTKRSIYSQANAGNYIGWSSAVVAAAGVGLIFYTRHQASVQVSATPDAVGLAARGSF